MKKRNFYRINCLVFAWIFASAAVVFFIAGIDGYVWHFYTSGLSGMTSGMIFYAVREDSDLD